MMNTFLRLLLSKICARGQGSQRYLEVGEVILVADSRVWIDHQGVVVRGGVLEQTVRRIEHLLGQEVEPFPEIKAKY
jgi:hypothetical protein